jgi:hypothetical protein
LYLKRKHLKGSCHFLVCKSYRDEGYWRHRELTDLGPDPGAHVVYPGGNSFYVSEALEETLKTLGVSYTPDDLERLFIPFLKPRIRRIVERFDRGTDSSGRWRSCSSSDLMFHQKQLHAFDKRRLHYLRCGRVDIGNLEARPWKFLNVLLEKSRDEIETLFEEMEMELPPQEVRSYLYTALELQTHFSRLSMRNHPDMLDPEQVDHYFLEDLCRLNEDPGFFRGVDRGGAQDLHCYLVRYLIMYFDNAFSHGFREDEYGSDFIGRHRFYRPPRKGHGLSPVEKEACRCLDISPEEFKKMNRRSLARHYRRCAMVAHPDKGGGKEAFVEITQAYECLLRLKH